MKPITLFRPSVFLPSAFMALCGLALLVPGRVKQTAQQQQQQQAAQDVDLVLALDTSSSMNGLIDGARAQLWESVSTLAKAQPRPNLRVGLISYGNTGYDAAKGWVRLESELTTDLDAVYGKLFALTTGGGEEYVARALQVAATQLQWTQAQRARRIFIVAGNEPATQDPQVSLEQAVGLARQRGITVNAIYCGSESNLEVAGWRGLAQSGAGVFAAIDHNSAVAINTPVDGQLQQLSQRLNATYLGYGGQGRARAENQQAQDRNALSASPAVAAARAVAKSGALYRNDDWDLVDAKKAGKLEQIKEADLPAELRKLSPAERQAYVDQKAAEREQIQKEIERLSREREGFIKAKKPAHRGKKDLNDAFDAML